MFPFLPSSFSSFSFFIFPSFLPLSFLLFFSSSSSFFPSSLLPFHFLCSFSYFTPKISSFLFSPSSYFPFSFPFSSPYFSSTILSLSLLFLIFICLLFFFPKALNLYILERINIELDIGLHDCNDIYKIWFVYNLWLYRQKQNFPPQDLCSTGHCQESSVHLCTDPELVL